MVPPNSGKVVKKKPKVLDITIIAKRSQNHVLLSFFTGKSKSKKAPLRKKSLTKRKEAIPNPLKNK